VHPASSIQHPTSNIQDPTSTTRTFSHGKHPATQSRRRRRGRSLERHSFDATTTEEAGRDFWSIPDNNAVVSQLKFDRSKFGRSDLKTPPPFESFFGLAVFAFCN
jgi:hypothetical protein